MTLFSGLQPPKSSDAARSGIMSALRWEEERAHDVVIMSLSRPDLRKASITFDKAMNANADAGVTKRKKRPSIVNFGETSDASGALSAAGVDADITSHAARSDGRVSEPHPSNMMPGLSLHRVPNLQKWLAEREQCAGAKHVVARAKDLKELCQKKARYDCELRGKGRSGRSKAMASQPACGSHMAARKLWGCDLWGIEWEEIRHNHELRPIRKLQARGSLCRNILPRPLQETGDFEAPFAAPDEKASFSPHSAVVGDFEERKANHWSTTAASISKLSAMGKAHHDARKKLLEKFFAENKCSSAVSFIDGMKKVSESFLRKARRRATKKDPSGDIYSATLDCRVISCPFKIRILKRIAPKRGENEIEVKVIS